MARGEGEREGERLARLTLKESKQNPLPLAVVPFPLGTLGECYLFTVDNIAL